VTPDSDDFRVECSTILIKDSGEIDTVTNSEQGSEIKVIGPTIFTKRMAEAHILES